MRLLGEVTEDTAPPPRLPRFAPPSRSRFGRGCVHYGIMIPDLPPPHHFMANMTVIGYSGWRAWDDDSALQGTARGTAIVGHGTAATTHDPFSSHGASECDFAPDGSMLCFGDDYTISGRYPNFRLVSTRRGFGVDLALTATGEVSWFANSRFYQHLSLLTRYQGNIMHNGADSAVAGLCTFEYGTGLAPYMIASRPLPPRLKLPNDFFTYHVINLDTDTQLLLVVVGTFGRQPGVVGAWLRTVGGGAKRLGTTVRFEVLDYRPEPVVGHDGQPMAVPSSFTWTIRDGHTVLARLMGTVDTQWLHAGMGNIAGYKLFGEFDGRVLTGRGYLEYSDRRHGRP
ncbi:DUF6670 family protein [Nocardia sp. NPDC051570]|uniref:DUF6670 family protein n=1 Tax=Nocardia sp. NPDC051570 TaxID=3364324 RepID=UPI0037B84BB2